MIETKEDIKICKSCSYNCSRCEYSTLEYEGEHLLPTYICTLDCDLIN